MKKVLTYILIVLTLFAVSAQKAYAQEADSSASLKTEASTPSYDFRVENLRNFFNKFNSPLAPYAQDFVNYADINGLDYRLVPSISGVESTFGKQIPYESYNAYGWVNGDYNFKSWPDSINIVSTTLKNNYIDKGASTIMQIARRYAPPSTTWGSHVTYFVGKIDALPLNFVII